MPGSRNTFCSPPEFCLLLGALVSQSALHSADQRCWYLCTACEMPCNAEKRQWATSLLQQRQIGALPVQALQLLHECSAKLKRASPAPTQKRNFDFGDCQDEYCSCYQVPAHQRTD